MTMKDVNVFIFFASSFTSDDNRYNKWRYILKRLSDCPFKNNFPFYITKSEHDSYNYQFKLTANHYMISASVMKKDFSNCFTRCLLSVSDDIFCVSQLNWKKYNENEYLSKRRKIDFNYPSFISYWSKHHPKDMIVSRKLKF